MLSIICQKTNDFISQMPKTLRKEYFHFRCGGWFRYIGNFDCA